MARKPTYEELGQRIRVLEEESAKGKRTEEALKERVKELNCLYGMSALLELSGISLDEIVKRTVMLLPPAWQFPEITEGCIVLEGRTFQTARFRETSWMQTCKIIVKGKPVGQVEVCYLEERQASDEGPFLKEERKLLNAIAERLGRTIERMRAEQEQLRLTEEIRLLLQSTGEGIYGTDTNGLFTFINRAGAAMLGYSPEELMGKPAHAVVHHSHADGSVYPSEECPMNRTLQSGQECRIDNEVLWRKDGTSFFVEYSSHPMLQGGEIKGVVVSFLDITGRKEAEEALRESEAFTSNVLEFSPTPILVLNPDTSIRYVNPAFEKLTGYASEELLGKKAPYPWWMEKQGSGDILALKRNIPKGAQGLERVFRRKNGETFWVEITTTPIRRNGELRYALMTWVNITERKQAEGELRVSHRFLVIANRHTEMSHLLKEFVVEVQNFTGCAAVGLRMLDEEGNIPYEAYAGFSRTFYESESPLSIKSDQCMCINVIKGVADTRHSFYTEGGSFYINGTTRFLATLSEEEKGRTRNVCNQMGYESVALVPIRMEKLILGLIHMADPRENMAPLEMVEVLERAAMQLGAAIQRVRAEEALAAERERLLVIFRSIGDGVITTDTKGNILMVNSVAELLTGWTLEEALGKPIAEVFHIRNETTNQVCENPVDKVLEAGTIVGLANHTILISKDGTRRIIADSGAPIIDGKGNILGVVIVFRDITDRMKMEEELIRNQVTL